MAKVRTVFGRDIDVATLNELAGDAFLSLDCEKKKNEHNSEKHLPKSSRRGGKHRESLSSVFGQLMVNEDKEALA